jgi:hypothetical protein
MALPLAAQQRLASRDRFRRLDAERACAASYSTIPRFYATGDMESAYQAVEKMKFGDFVDALEAVHAEEKSPKASKRSTADTLYGQMKE